MIINEVKCKSILNKSGIATIDYTLNPYTGCEHGCIYCYAVFMKRFSNHKEEWGSFVDVKINAPEVLKKQVKRLKPGVVSLSTVTDPYQQTEKKYYITRKCLEGLVDSEFSVSILTKSPLVVRDIDILRELKDANVGFSIALIDEKVKRVFESKTPSINERFKALSELSKEGIDTWLFFSPVLPYFSDNTETIEEIFLQASQSGVDSILVDTLQLYTKAWSNIKKILIRFYPDILPKYKHYLMHKDSYKNELKLKVIKVAKKYNIPCEFTF